MSDELLSSNSTFSSSKQLSKTDAVGKVLKDSDSKSKEEPHFSLISEIDFVHLLIELLAEHIEEIIHSKGSLAIKSLKPSQKSFACDKFSSLFKYL